MSSFAMVGMDLDLSSGNLVIVQDEDTNIAQKLTIRFQLFLGEWFMDARVGVPYLQVVFVKNPNLVIIGQLFRNVIYSTPGIANVLSENISFVPATRSLLATYKIQTISGAILEGGVGSPFIVTVPVQRAAA
jgi:hypothetical protein